MRKSKWWTIILSYIYIYIRNSINPKQSSNELDKRFGCSGRFDDVLDEDVKLKEYLNVQVIIYINNTVSKIVSHRQCPERRGRNQKSNFEGLLDMSCCSQLWLKSRPKVKSLNVALSSL